MNKIKVGDRVSARPFNGIESLGTVIYVEEEQQHFDILVKFDTWDRGHNGGEFYYEKFGLEYDEEASNHWWFNDNDLVVVGKSDE